ncbi:Diguanylate phosphodiesterase, partial [Pseudomonas aeruginosa]|nr:Diguanylate phosphodiesterase [Pseudomonas aeruginosa]
AKPMPAAAFAVFVSQWRGATMNASDSVIFRRRLHQLIGRNGCCAASS